MRLFQEYKRYISVKQLFIQLESLLCISAHAAYGIKDNRISCLYFVQNLFQFFPSLKFGSGVDFLYYPKSCKIYTQNIN